MSLTRKEQTSVFDEILSDLAGASCSKETDDLLVEIQQLEAEIVNLYKKKYLNQREYKALNAVVTLIHSNIHDVIRN